MGTDNLLDRLHAIGEAPWGDWYGHPLSPRDLAKLLKPYGVTSTKVKDDGQSVRGYRSEDLWDVWQRYAPDTRQACTKCGEPLDQALIDAGFTDHGEDGQP